MSNWIDWDRQRPPSGELVLVYFDDFVGYGLRSITDQGDLYDEHENLDDSELVPECWLEIPSR